MHQALIQKHANQTNPCARILGEIAKTCFLIGAETDYDAHFSWSAHVNEVTVQVTRKGAPLREAVLEFEDYMNLPKTTGFGSDDWRTDTYPKVKKFAADLNKFYAKNAA